MTKQRITSALQEYFGDFLSAEDQRYFIEAHNDEEFTGEDEPMAAKYFAVDYFKGYVQNFMATQLEDAGYWND